MANTSGIKAGKAFVYIEALDKTSAVLARVGKKIKDWGSSITSIGSSMATKAAAALVPVALSTNIFASFDDSLRRVEARSSGTAEEMTALRDQAKLLGLTTAHAASQIGMLQGVLAQKGFNRKQIAEMVPAIRDLSMAAGTGNTEADTVNAADLTASTLRAFQMESDQTTRVADVLAAAVNNSSTSLEDLGTALPYVSSVAKRFNMSLEDTVAMVGAIQNLGFKAEQAGTAARNMFLELSNPASAAKFNDLLLEATGNTITFTDASDNLRPVPDILRDIGIALDGVGTGKQSEIMSTLFGMKGIAPAGALSANISSFAELADKMAAAGGTAKRTSDLMEGGLGGTLRNLWSAVEGVALALGGALSPTLSGVISYFTNGLQAFSRWIEANKNIVVLAFGAVVAFGAMGVSLIAIGTALKIVGTGFSVLSIALKIFSPTGLLVAGLAAGVIALMHYSGVLGAFVSRVKSVMSSIGAAIMGGRFDLAAKIAWAGLQVVWTKGVAWLQGTWDLVSTSMATTMVAMWGQAKAIWIAGVGGLRMLILDLADFIAQTLGDSLKGLLTITANTAILSGNFATAGLAKQMLSELEANPTFFHDKANQARGDTLSALAQTGTDTAGAIDNINSDYARREAQRQAGVDAASQALTDAEQEARAALAEVATSSEMLSDAMTSPETMPILDVAAGAPSRSTLPTLIQGLEKGSKDALSKFYENQNNGVDGVKKAVEDGNKIHNAILGALVDASGLV